MSYDTEVAADTPQIYWKLQEASGTAAADSSGNARPGVYNGTAAVNYALNQSVSMLSTDTTLKSVKMMRDSAVEGGHPTTASNLNDATDANGRASVSRAYDVWMNVAGAAFSTECWAKVPSTLHRYASSISSMLLVARRATYPLQHQISLGGLAGAPTAARWADRLNATNNSQPAYGASFFMDEASMDVFVGGTPTTGYEDAYSPSAAMATCFDDTPHHYVATYGTASIRLYRDGVLSSIYYTSGVPAIASNTADALSFGGIWNGTTTNVGLLGWMSHCAHYPSELSAARVAAHFTAGGAKIAFLNQQWALLAGQSMTVSATVNATASAGFNAMSQMVFSSPFNATTNLLPAYRAGMAVAAQVNATTLLTPNAILGVSFMNSASIADSVGMSGFMQMALSNIAGVSSAIGMNGIMGMTLSDVVTAAIVIQAGDIEYNGWILNPNLVASTGLTGFAFNSFVKHKGKYYGVGDGGIYELGGPNDNGVSINAFVGLPRLDFGTEQKKSVPYAYIGVTSENQMVLRVLVSGTVYTYIARNATTEMAEQRVDIGKGLRSTYWQFELINEAGADFELDTIKFMPVVLERRI